MTQKHIPHKLHSQHFTFQWKLLVYIDIGRRSNKFQNILFETEKKKPKKQIKDLMPSSCRNLGSYLIHVFLRCSMTKVFYEKRSYRSICNSNGILYVVICKYNNFFVIVFGLIRFFTKYFSFPLWPSRF